MKNQHGGLKLKNPSKQGFTPVYDMINSPSGNLNLLTYKSLKGFMISLDVNSEDTEYLTLSGSQFTKPVTSFILKFAVITPDNDETLPSYKTIDKSSESKESYFDEAKLQQRIWKTSIFGGRPEICPPVANFSLFDNNNSKNLLQFLQSKTSGDTKEIFDYLFNCVNNDSSNGIGVIIMPKVEMSTTFGDFIYKPNGTNFYRITINTEYKNDAYAYVTAQIARLFINIGVIHFDLHSGNALIYLTSDNKIKSLLIDFGRASDIMIDKDDDYLTISEKQEMRKMKGDFFDTLFSIESDAPDKTKANFIISVLDYIADVDYDKNQQLFQFSDPNRYQMDWYKNYPKRSFVPVKAFDILKESVVTEGTKMMPNTIKQYERQGFLINFDKDISSFIVPFPISSQLAPVPSSNQVCDKETGMCTIMGGKKYKRTRKIKKTKKTRKTRKTKKSKKIRH
jgi:hypothetical protein